MALRLGGGAPPAFRRLVRSMADFTVEANLNEEQMLKTASRFAAQPPLLMQTQEPLRKAAVLIPVCVSDGELSLLYTVRASNMRLYKGQVSFPGGMQDDKDDSLEMTVLRETKEELGIPANKITLWGRGSFIAARMSHTSVVPIIGTIGDDVDLKKLKINPTEVEAAFTVPIRELCKRSNTGFTQFRTGYSTPVFLGGPRRIWGLTGLITNLFLKCMFPHDSYLHRVRYLPPIKSSHKFQR